MKLKNNALQELYDTIVNGTHTFSPYETSPIDKDFEKCDEKIQKDIDIWKCGNEILHSANLDLASNKRKLEKEIEGLKEHVLENHKIVADIGSERDALAKERDDLLSRAHCAEDEVEELKIELHTAEEARNNLRAELEAKVKRMDEITNDRDFFFKQYHALKDDYEKLKTRTDCLRVEVEWYRKHYRDQSDKIEYITSKYQKLTSENKRLQNNVRAGYDQGQTDLWVKLQDVSDVKPDKFDPECETLGDVIDMDLEDFLDAYKKWQEEKEKDRLDHMRDYLARFCEGRLCEKCPLHKDGFNCSRGKWLAGVPDEKIKRYYEKVRGCKQYTLKNVTYYFDNKPVTMAEEVVCENFCKAVRDTDIKITENLRKGCTFEATVNVDKDLLEKVCGVKPKEEEHNLEYGDAVRVPWRDYDYMYIGPDEEEETIVRMFDPKNHAIATTHIGNVRYNGGKIIICEEDDLRKIWKDKK